MRTPRVASFGRGSSIRLTAESMAPTAIWAKARAAKPETAAPVSAAETEAPTAAKAAPMAAPTGGMGSDPECGDGGGERQHGEAALRGGGEELGAADHGERRSGRGVEHGEIAEAREGDGHLREALADEGDGIAVAAGTQRPAAAGQRGVADAEVGDRIDAGDRLDRAGGEAGAVVTRRRRRALRAPRRGRRRDGCASRGAGSSG